jgi:predicted ATP-grasp superfamily ATP-dependent carboligase
MVLVTDGDQRSTLAVVRSLGKAKIPVTVGECGPRSLAGSSRYCAGRLCYPSPYEDAEGFKRFLLEAIARGDYQMLMPTTDVTARLVAEIQEKITDRVIVPMPSADVVKRSQDKAHVLALARQLGIPCPRTVDPVNDQDLPAAARGVGFPVVIKTRSSYFYQDGRWRTGGIQYACSLEQLAAKYSASQARSRDLMLQEKLTGEGRGVFLLVWNGELKGAFCHRRLREKPPWGGVSVYRESIAPDEKLIQQSFALLKALGWQGVAMVEFKVDNRDGRAKLMEVNGRFWGSLQLAIDAGADFPLLLYRLATGENVPAQFEYRVGVKSRWLLGDLDQLLITMRSRQRRNGFAPVSKLRALAQFLKFYEPGIRYEVFRMNDPKPGWFESKSYFGAMIRKAVVSD